MPHNFGYRIRDDGGQWTWAVLDHSGAVAQAGRAPTRAIAAACVIQHLVRTQAERTVPAAA